jgi:hypothetical protein
MSMPIGYHELRDTLTQWRPTSVDDDLGGSTDVLSEVGPVRAKVNQPAGIEQVEAMQPGSALTIILHFRPDADIRRGDILVRSDGDRMRVKYTVHPSERVYLRADCEQLQREGDVT